MEKENKNNLYFHILHWLLIELDAMGALQIE